MRLGGGFGMLGEREDPAPLEALPKGEGDLDRRRAELGTFCDSGVEESLSLVFVCRDFNGLELPGMFPEDGLFIGEVNEPPIDARFGVEVKLLPSFTSFQGLTVPEGDDPGGGGAREDLMLLLILAVAVVIVTATSLVVVGETLFKLSSNSCRSLSLFFTITLRLMMVLLAQGSGALLA